MSSTAGYPCHLEGHWQLTTVGWQKTLKSLSNRYGKSESLIAGSIALEEDLLALSCRVERIVPTITCNQTTVLLVA